MSASTEANKQLVRDFFERFGKDDLDWYRNAIAADVRVHTPVPNIPDGIDGFLALGRGFLDAFPQQHVDVDELIAEGDLVAARHTHYGIHGGELMGIPPTGKEIRVQGIEMFRISDGKIAEFWHNDDLLGLLQQLGAFPSS